MLWTQKLTFLNSDFFAKSENWNNITISKIMKQVQKLSSQQQDEHGGHFYWRHGYPINFIGGLNRSVEMPNIPYENENHVSPFCILMKTVISANFGGSKIKIEILALIFFLMAR